MLVILGAEFEIRELSLSLAPICKGFDPLFQYNKNTAVWRSFISNNPFVIVKKKHHSFSSMEKWIAKTIQSK